MKLIVIALNGCPIASLGPYGNEWIATPNLDRLAAEGVVFDHHISDCPDSRAARRVWRTGRNFDLLSAVTSRGIRTILVDHTRPANALPPEFLAGWSEVVLARPQSPDHSPSDELLRVLPTVFDRLTDASDWLLWIECDRLLPPWHVPQDVFEVYVEDLVEEVEPTEYIEQILPWTDPQTGWFDQDDFASWELLHRSIATAITVFDADLGRLFDLFRERGLDHSATWLFTADRGFPLGEHGQLGPHRPWLHAELVHLPLIVRFPNASQAGRHVTALTQSPDLLPTLATWFGIAVEPVAFDGFDLGPLLAGTVESVREFAVTQYMTADAEEWAIHTPEWSLLLPIRQPEDDDPRSPLLFEKPADYWEVNDQRSRHLETAEELEAKLRTAIPSGSNK